ncbi:MAG: hypothetical protein JW807_11690 [Spirochaetes bacterium]|nr:hypothetical protein [Spirochaetota bacterium]
MNDKKKYAAAAVIVIVVLINILATLRLLFSVVCPERAQKEIVVNYFKDNLNKAVKFEEITIDYTGNVIIDDFNVSITSDFNDNISLIKSKRAVIDLAFWPLWAGSVRINGIDFYDSEITFIKKYGRSHMECVRQILDPGKFIKTVQEAYPDFYIDFHGSAISYRESLRDRLLVVELYTIDAELYINTSAFSYDITGRIRPFRTSILRKGEFSCRGSVDIGQGDSFSHRIQIENFDLTYLNEYIQERKKADTSISGGASVDLEVKRNKSILTVGGQAWTNNLTVASITKKYNLISGENVSLDIDASYNSAHNSYTIRSLSVYDDVARLDASGSYVQNEKEDAVTLDFKSNAIDLSDLSQNVAPFPGIEYGGMLQFDGSLNMDFKKKKASGMRFNCVLGEFTVSRNRKGKQECIIGESSMRVKADNSTFNADISLKPLGSDLSISIRTEVSAWVPFSSEMNVSVKSRRMNLDIIREPAVYLIDAAYASAYKDKREVAIGRTPFPQTLLGKFANHNSISFTSEADTVFWGTNASWNNCGLDARLANGALSIGEFRADGYGAAYRFNALAYFNTEQPYFRVEGAVDDFDWSAFYADSGMKGSMTGKAGCDFNYEVSAARMGNILDNSRGNLNVHVGTGEMINTRPQQAIMKFLRKNGYEAGSVADITYESITLSLSQRGENFWFSNFGVRGDKLFFNAAGDYLYEGGITSTFGATVRKDATVIAIPVKVSGPLLGPCVDVANRGDSEKFCF